MFPKKLILIILIIRVFSFSFLNENLSKPYAFPFFRDFANPIARKPEPVPKSRTSSSPFSSAILINFFNKF